jgi:tryptophanase
MDVLALADLLEKSHNKIPLVYLTITNNTAGGQPVSMENIKEIFELSHNHDIPLFFDACRFAENAWFIKNREIGYENETIKDIVKEMFFYADGFTISFKKDGLSNMGGGIFLKRDGLFVEKYPEFAESLFDYQVIKEGNYTQGGFTDRDKKALCAGLELAVSDEYLDYRIKQVSDFGTAMFRLGIPVLMPTGGHAVYVDMNRFFKGTKMKLEDFGGVAFTIVLLRDEGHRACELGYFAFGNPKMNFVRFAVPRLRYEKEDLDSAAAAVKRLYDKNDEIPPIDIVYGRKKTLRHFKARFKFRE